MSSTSRLIRLASTALSYAPTRSSTRISYRTWFTRLPWWTLQNLKRANQRANSPALTWSRPARTTWRSLRSFWDARMVQYGMAAIRATNMLWKRLIHWRKWSPGMLSALNQWLTSKSLLEKLNRCNRSPKSRQPQVIYAFKSLASSQRLYTRPCLQWRIRIYTSSMVWGR